MSIVKLACIQSSELLLTSRICSVATGDNLHQLEKQLTNQSLVDLDRGQMVCSQKRHFQNKLGS